MPDHAQIKLTMAERHLLELFARGHTPAQAAEVLCQAPVETEALLASLLRRHGLTTRRQLLARAVVYRWI